MFGARNSTLFSAIQPPNLAEFYKIDLNRGSCSVLPSKVLCSTPCRLIVWLRLVYNNPFFIPFSGNRGLEGLIQLRLIEFYWI
jgi:hypothetical protein